MINIIKEGNKCLKKISSLSVFYPLTIIIAGVKVNDKHNFIIIAFCSMFHYKSPMLYISSGKNNYSNQCIKKNQIFSVNFTSVDMVKATDYIGIKLGKDSDKSELFDVFYGELQTAPIIEEAPMNHECKLVKVLDLGGTNEIFIDEII